MSERTKRVFARVAESVGLSEDTLLPVFEGEDFFTLEISESISENELFVEALFVPIDCHGEGWGRKIIAALEEAAGTEGYTRISLRSFPYTIGKGIGAKEIRSLVSWYKSQGYLVVNSKEIENLKRGIRYTHETGSIDMFKKINRK